jgi:hypothetical protein
MTDRDLADRILAALRESERLDRQPVVRSDQVLAQLAAADDDVRSALNARDTQGYVRFTRGVVAGDVSVRQLADRASHGVRDSLDADDER